MAVQPYPGPSYPLQWYVFRAPAALGVVLDSTVFLKESEGGLHPQIVFVEANIISLTRGGCPPLPPSDEAMRVRVLRVLLLLLLLLLFVHAGGCCLVFY